MAHPIPSAALDDRLGFLGTSGSGKTYNAGVAVERLLSRKARVVIVDPLGVWWGLRLLADGKHQSPHNVVIFGGPRGDLPLTEHAGALIGETAATMAESCIVDLSELGSKSAERRFMTAFLDTLYRKASGEPFHLVVDEADLFAPQKPAGGGMSASSRCPHSDVHFNLNHVCLGDTNVHYVELKGECKICGKGIRFRGAPFGLTPTHPTMAVDGSEIVIPFLGDGEEPEGTLIGFTGRQVK